MNIIAEEFKKLEIRDCGLLYPKVMQVNDIFKIEEHLCEMENTPRMHTYRVILKLGRDVVSEEEFLPYVKRSVVCSLIDYLYGDIYSKLLQLRVAIWENNNSRALEVIGELLDDTRPEY